MSEATNDIIRQSVRELYGKIATGQESDCCNTKSECCGDVGQTYKERSEQIGYTNEDVNQAPNGANLGLGCGNPKAIAALKPGETVVDLGAGAGFDCFLAVEAVGETGKVIGVDMTPPMVSKSRAINEEAGHTNVEFRLGEIEHLPVADGTVDVIISNCVINLSPDKPKVFREAHRVLKPGGRLAISDVVATVDIPQSLKEDMTLYADCVTGASKVSVIEFMLEQAGFVDIAIEPKDSSREYINTWTEQSKLEDCVHSATIEAIKPTHR